MVDARTAMEVGHAYQPALCRPPDGQELRVLHWRRYECTLSMYTLSVYTTWMKKAMPRPHWIVYVSKHVKDLGAYHIRARVKTSRVVEAINSKGHNEVLMNIHAHKELARNYCFSLYIWGLEYDSYILWIGKWGKMVEFDVEMGIRVGSVVSKIVNPYS